MTEQEHLASGGEDFCMRQYFAHDLPRHTDPLAVMMTPAEFAFGRVEALLRANACPVLGEHGGLAMVADAVLADAHEARCRGVSFAELARAPPELPPKAEGRLGNKPPVGAYYPVLTRCNDSVHFVDMRDALLYPPGSSFRTLFTHTVPAGAVPHVWERTVETVTAALDKGYAPCPYCADREPLVGFNTISTLHPTLCTPNDRAYFSDNEVADKLTTKTKKVASFRHTTVNPDTGEPGEPHEWNAKVKLVLSKYEDIAYRICTVCQDAGTKVAKAPKRKR